MSETKDEDGREATGEGAAGRGGTGGRTQAAVRRSRWPGWIWAVPLAAAAIVGWLAFRHFAQEGPSITLSFPEAGGIESGSTEVRYRGVTVGTVESLALGEDREQVEATVQMQSSVAELLREETRFWLVGGDVGLDNLSGLRTLVSGPYIAMSPGPGEPMRTFEGEASAPPVPPGAEGRRFVLTGDRVDGLAAGTPLTYHGLEVGSVVETRLAGADAPDAGDRFEIEVFVRAPHDRLVRDDSRFWNASALQLSLGGGGASASLASPEALLSGLIAFETPSAAPPSRAVQAAAEQGQAGGTDEPPRFRLFAGHPEAVAGTLEGARYRLALEGAVGGLRPGQPIRFRGFVVGRVVGRSLRYDAARSRLETPVTIEIDAARLDLAEPASGGDGEGSTDPLARLVADGLRARLALSPPLIGGPVVTLTFDPDAEPAELDSGGEHPAIPVAASAGIAGLVGSAQGALEDVRQMELPRVARQIREAVGEAGELIRHADGLVTSPEIDRSLANLDRALADVETITQSARGKVGPAIDSLRRAAADARDAVAAAEQVLGGRAGAAHRSLPGALEEIAGAARALRVLAEYLERNPEALLQGRSR